VELQADVGKVCDLLDLFHPINLLSNNTSNFVFIPVTWANNLFQNWTDDPVISAQNTTDATTEDGGHLARPSKLGTGRPKALILIVNKPDWFEPGELTYLGYNNDFSEIPMAESDCIRFDIDYTLTSKILVFSASHTSGSISGAKGVLTFTGTGVSRANGFYECASGSGTLSFPKKYLVKIVVENMGAGATIRFTNVTGNTATHAIGGRTEFYIEPSKMTANNVAFAMTNIRLISAEITNRPYEAVTVTGTNATSSAINVTLSRNLAESSKYQLKVVVESKSSEGYAWRQIEDVGLDDQLMSLVYGDGKWVVLGYRKGLVAYNEGSGWSSFASTASFGDYPDCWGLAYGGGKWMVIDYAGKVIVGEANNLSNCTPSFIFGQAVYSEGYTSLIYGDGKWVAINSNRGRSAIYDGSNWSEINGTGLLDDALNGYWVSFVYGDGKWMALSGSGNTAVYHGDANGWIETTNRSLEDLSGVWQSLAYDNGKWKAASADGYVAIYDDDINDWREITGYGLESYRDLFACGDGKWMRLTEDGYSFIHEGSDWREIKEGVNLRNISDWWHFLAYGDGKWMAMSVYGKAAVYEMVSSTSGTITIGGAAQTVSGRQEFYVDVSSSGATTSIPISNVNFISAEIVDRSTHAKVDPVYQFPKLRLPVMSRTVDFSQNVNGRPKFSCNSIAYGETAAAHGEAGSVYDSGLGYWVACDSSVHPGMSVRNHTFNQNTLGDFYLLLENVGNTAPEGKFFNKSRGPATYDNRKCEDYYLAGLNRKFQEFSDLLPVDYAYWNIDNASSAKIKYICGGFTWPINAVLCLGMDGGTEKAYSWQTVTNDANGNTTAVTDPSVACQNVTKSACAKLRTDFGLNVRIYVIKYRKQPNYKHPISETTTAFDYSYLDSCASGTAAPYLYDVSDEAGLNNALSAIAANIKTFGGYEGAKNVAAAQ
jgi:hypothetical protein